MEVGDNASFEIAYRGFKILHLADAQAFISAIDDPVVKRRVKARYPGKYDLVFMTIDGPSDIAAQAATFLDLLAPARAIPMHYWSQEAKADFLTELRRLNRTGRGGADRFTIAETGCSDFSLYADSPPRGTRVISLEPSPLFLSPSTGVLSEEGAAVSELPAEPCEDAVAPSGRDVTPGRQPRGGEPPGRQAPGWQSRRRYVPGPPPIHRPAAAASQPGRGSSAMGSAPTRRAASAPPPSRDRTRVTAHTGRDLG